MFVLDVWFGGPIGRGRIKIAKFLLAGAIVWRQCALFLSGFDFRDVVVYSAQVQVFQNGLN